MSLTQRDLALLSSSLYGNPGSNPVSWLYKSNPDANVVMGIVRRDKYLIVTCRGSFDLEDWVHDILARPIDPEGRPEIKSVHQGFYGGTPEAWDIVDFHYTPSDLLIFSGHSLGAARSIILAAHAVAHGITPHFICLWGEPAPFRHEGNAIVSLIPAVSYRNKVDGVPDPVTKSTTMVGYEHPYPITDVHAIPKSDRLDPLALHHFELYQSVTPEIEI